MKFTIKENCVCCGACAMDCPVEAITRGEKTFLIGPSCIGCGDCYTICPVGAIVPVETIARGDVQKKETQEIEHHGTESRKQEIHKTELHDKNKSL